MGILLSILWGAWRRRRPVQSFVDRQDFRLAPEDLGGDLTLLC